MASTRVRVGAWGHRIVDAIRRKIYRRPPIQSGPGLDTYDRAGTPTAAEQKLRASLARLERDFPHEKRVRAGGPNQNEDVSGWDPWRTGNRR